MHTDNRCRKVHMKVLFFLFLVVLGQTELRAEVDLKLRSYEYLAENPWTDHVQHTAKLFQLLPVSSFLEFGMGEGTKFYLDQCDHVTSVETLGRLGRSIHERCYQQCLSLYKNYPNWNPLLYDCSSDICEAVDMVHEFQIDPAVIDPTYLEEIKELCDDLFAKRSYDVVLVDPGLILQGDIINELFDRTDIIVAHDFNGNSQLYGWYKIKTPAHYQLIHFTEGEGTAFWIKKTRGELIHQLQTLLRNASPDLKERATPLSMKVSVIIPCYFKHFALLPELLTYYVNQTVLPDEVVISLSESDRVSQDTIRAIETNSWPFSLKLVCSKEKLTAGQNRNVACKNSSGDLIICQDADDIPHPQRVEIIKHHFENYEIDHLLHFWIPSNVSFQRYDVNQIAEFGRYFKVYDEAINCFKVGDSTNGNCSFRKEVFQLIQWSDIPQAGEDVQFNYNVYQLFKNKVIFKLPLLYYRKTYSTFGNNLF